MSFMKIIVTALMLQIILSPSSWGKDFDRNFVNKKDSSKKMILVITDSWDAPGGVIRLYDKKDGSWKKVDNFSKQVVVGRKGLGWGIGIHPKSIIKEGEPIKREGDKKAPAGFFSLDKTFGHQSMSGVNNLQFYLQKDTVCIDDSRSPLYNRIVMDFSTMPQVIDNTPISHEKMFSYTGTTSGKKSLYNLGIVVNHNTNQVKGAGSCIFMHVWKSSTHGTAGCTAMNHDDLKKIVEWRKNSETLFVQLPRSVFLAFQKMGILPNL